MSITSEITRLNSAKTALKQILLLKGCPVSDNDTIDKYSQYLNNITGKYDWSIHYLTFTAIENTTFSFTTNNLQYSLDDGSTWTTLSAGSSTPTISAGNKIMWKQTGLTPTASNGTYDGIGTFSATGNFNASGNVMSLYYGDNFVNQTDLTGKNYAFSKLFYKCSKLISAKNLLLPAKTLAHRCYLFMFQYCTSLTTAPELPATTLTESCYESMFSFCTSLISAPELPATTLAMDCYEFMFRSCTSLMTAPELPATTLTRSCYQNMFSNCTSLMSAPELPATTLAIGCYIDMFGGCTSLTKAPALPATTLTQQCYQSMFQDCTSLTAAPALPAITLASSCYYSMFLGCTNLNYIKCLATNISSSICTYNWVNGVAATGTFVKDVNMTGWTTGVNGIPTNWTIIINYPSDSIGKIIGTNGFLYNNITEAENDGTIAAGMIAFLGTINNVCDNGLAISLTNVYEYNVTYEQATGNYVIPTWNSSHSVPNASWRLPSVKDWQYLLIGTYSDNPSTMDISNFNNKLAICGGTMLSNNSDSYFWTSTEENANYAKLLYYDGSRWSSFINTEKTNAWAIRACLSF